MLWSALAAALWGGLYVVTQLAAGAHFPAATLSVARLALGVAALLALLAAQRRAPRLRDRGYALLGLVVAATLLTQTYGTYLSGGATGSLLTLLTPVFVALLAPLLLAERTGPWQWLGIALGLAGAALVIGPAGAGSPLGDALLVAASLAWAAFTVLGAPLVRERGALEVTAAAGVWALPPMAVAAAVELALGAQVRITPGALLEIAYLGLGATALGWWAWYRGVEKAPAAAAAVPFLLQPIVGVGLAIPLFGAPLTPGFLVGGGLVAAGMLVAGRR